MNKRKIPAMIAGLSLALCLAACGDSEESVRDASSTPEAASSAADTNNSTPADSTPDESEAAPKYDPNGDERMFDSLKEQFGGNYALTGMLSINGGDKYPVMFEVKGDLRYASATVMGMVTERYITEEGDLYVINQGTTVYEKYNHDELGNMIQSSPQYDPLFASTGAFTKAELNGDVISEEYALDYEGVSGSITYFFNESGALTGVKIDSSDMDNEELSDVALTAAKDEDFTLPDLSAYVRNN